MTDSPDPDRRLRRRAMFWFVLCVVAVCTLFASTRRPVNAVPPEVARLLDGYTELDKNNLLEADLRALGAAAECLPSDRVGQVAMLLGNRIFVKRSPGRVSYRVFYRDGAESGDEHMGLVNVEVGKDGRCTFGGLIEL